MADQHTNITSSVDQGLSRLSKEKLVEIVSNLMHMPVAVAEKALEHVPEYFEICREEIQGILSMHKENEAYSTADAQMIFEGLESRRRLLETSYQEAETQEEKDFYLSKLEELDQETENERAKIEEERAERKKGTVKALMIMASLAGAAIGVGVRIGKRK